MDEFAFDVFISHASEDKEPFVGELARALRRRGLVVWYDEFTLRPGDNLRRSIDAGLATSRYGIVVLSRAFFGKEWPQRELDGLTALEMSDGRKRILPVWHEVTQADVAAASPTLAGIFAARSASGPEQTADTLLGVIGNPDDRRYEHRHVDERVDVVALARESGDMALNLRYFLNCTLVGPAVLGIDDGMQMTGCYIHREMFLSYPSARRFVGIIPARHTRFEGCRFEDIGIIGPPHEVERVLLEPDSPDERSGQEAGARRQPRT